MNQEQTQVNEVLEELVPQTQNEQDERVELFLSSVKSKETKEKYSIYLKKYQEITGIKNLFHTKDPREIEKEIIKFVIAMSKKGMTYTAMKNYTTAVFSFYKINDIVLNTTKISKFMPENRKIKNDRAYTREEIAKLLEIADERSRVIVLLLASSGMRVGAITSLKIRNLDSKFNKILIYESTPEQYFSFITPECKKAVDAYLDMRKRYGEKLTANSPLVREQYDIRNPITIKSPKPVESEGLQWILRDLAYRYNVISGRDVPVAHGFRYFWMTQAVNCEINAEIREMLLGHKIGLASDYYRPTVDKMYAEYSKLIDALTIDHSQRLEKQVQTLKQDNTQFGSLAVDLQKEREEVRRLQDKHDEEIRRYYDKREEDFKRIMADYEARMQMLEKKTLREIQEAEKKAQLTKRQIKKR